MGKGIPIAPDGRSVHDAFMAEDDIGEIRDELNEYKKQLDALREDLRLLIEHSEQAKNSIISYSIQTGNPESGI